MRRRFKWDKTYLHWGITAFCVIAAAVLFYYIITNVPAIAATIGNIFRILAPFVWGLVICYLLSPLMRMLETRVFQPMSRVLYRKSKKHSGKGFARAMAVIFSEIILVVVLVALVSLILPQVLSSLQTLTSNRNSYIDNLTVWAENLLKNYPGLEEYVSNLLGNFSTNVGNWLETKLIPQLGNIVASVSSGVYGFARSIYNLIIGIIASIYLLSDRERYKAAVKRLSYSLFSVETAEHLREMLSFMDKTFMSFINGKLLDSLIIGIICYIGCTVMQMPYTLLVSVIIGLTNIIPFFGPLIGAIPSALIILMVDPVKCLIFIVFIIILQQVDGNIIGPRILGNSTGITGFWVMFSIILGGGLFKFWGLLLGVQVFVVIHTLVNDKIVQRLQKEDLPSEISDYEEIEYIDPATRQIVKKASVRKKELALERARREKKQSEE